MNDFIRVSSMVFEVFASQDENSSIAGNVVLVDTKGMTPAHMLQFTPTIMKKSAIIWQV